MSQYINIVTLQGDDYAEFDAAIDLDGETAGVDYLAQWDNGDETTDARIIMREVYSRGDITRHGYVHDAAPYLMTYDRRQGIASLYRAVSAEEIARWN